MADMEEIAELYGDDDAGDDEPAENDAAGEGAANGNNARTGVCSSRYVRRGVLFVACSTLTDSCWTFIQTRAREDRRGENVANPATHEYDPV